MNESEEKYKMESGNECADINLPGINIRDALDELGIGMDIYKEILDVFVKTNCDFINEIQRLYEKKDWAGLDKLAHSIKGSAGNIRANDLEKAGFDLEMACKNFDLGKTGQEPDPGLVDRLETELMTVKNSIEKIEKTDDCACKPGINDLDTDGLIESCHDFINALQNSDPEKIKSGFMILSRYMDDQASYTIGSHINNYEYDKAEKAFGLIVEDILKNN